MHRLPRNYDKCFGTTPLCKNQTKQKLPKALGPYFLLPDRSRFVSVQYMTDERLTTNAINVTKKTKKTQVTCLTLAGHASLLNTNCIIW